MSLRYLTPVIDVGVRLEGENGTVIEQVLQINRLFPDDPCVYCRKLINSQIVAQELMSEDEKKRMEAEAVKAAKEGRPANAYWIDIPQLNTVGYLTTLAGSLVSGFTIGYLTGRFGMMNNRLQLSFNAKGTGLAENPSKFDKNCSCNECRGVADQNLLAVMISAPEHWEAPVIYKE
jgi:hypothetical protein